MIEAAFFVVVVTIVLSLWWFFMPEDEAPAPTPRDRACGDQDISWFTPEDGDE